MRRHLHVNWSIMAFFSGAAYMINSISGEFWFKVTQLRGLADLRQVNLVHLKVP